MKIIIVESPSKSHTIESYMGSDYKVVASQGHIRDLSTKGKDGLGIDIPAGFIPRYEIIKGKEKIVADLKKLCNKNEVYLATDPDREGEAISWHLASVLGLDINKVNRVEFNEITKPAVTKAFENTRKIDLALVQSQETRRMLDRIIGFDLSSLLQKKIKMQSAGRVQSSVLKIIVDLEKEIVSFIPEKYYQIEALINEKKVNLVDDKLKTLQIKDKEEAFNIKDFLSKEFICKDIINKEAKREAKAPLITSTLQQDASNKYGFTPTRTMRAAQSLYEGKDIGDMHVGLITYMRTDSIRFSDVFVSSAMNYIEEHFGKEYLGHVKKKKNNDLIQDAHEAIRPTSLDRTPELMDKYLTPDERKIYRLVYNSSLASLMAPAKYAETTVVFDNNGYNFKMSGKKLLFNGYLALSGISDEDKDELLFDINVGDKVKASKIEALELETKPKARFTEATIIKTMEEKNIGRPSTYAQTISILKTRKYIEVIDRKIYPTDAGKLTIAKLEEFFSEIIAPTYTADMEKTLDLIASGQLNNVIELQKFYDRFYPIFVKAKNDMTSLPLEETGELCPLCGSKLVYRVGRFGKFVSCSNYPECKYKPQREEPNDKEVGILCPICLKGNIIQRISKGKPFYACSNYPKCKNTYPYKPVQEYCPVCESVMLEGPHGLFCSNRNCDTNKNYERKTDGSMK